MRKRGRKRVHANDAARQAAFRARNKDRLPEVRKDVYRAAKAVAALLALLALEGDAFGMECNAATDEKRLLKLRDFLEERRRLSIGNARVLPDNFL